MNSKDLALLNQQYKQSLGLLDDCNTTQKAYSKDSKDQEDYLLSSILDTLSKAITDHNTDKEDAYIAVSISIAKILDFYDSSNNEVLNNQVNHPKHYNTGKLETIEYLRLLGIDEPFCLGNAIKYLSRYRYKGKAVEDLSKALWYIEYLIK